MSIITEDTYFPPYTFRNVIINIL